jgi:hypothetical protein
MLLDFKEMITSSLFLPNSMTLIPTHVRQNMIKLISSRILYSVRDAKSTDHQVSIVNGQCYKIQPCVT